MKRAAKVDGNHAEIVKVLRGIGCSVQSLAAVGRGVPDLLVAYRNWTGLAEIKDPKRPPSGRKLTPAQVKWHGAWKAPVAVIATPEEAIAWCIEMTRGRA